MNPALSPLFKRRSIRAYQPKEVSDETVHDLLEAAMAAPSARACDPWRFVVVRDQAVRDRIAQGLPNGKMLTSSPLGIVVCGELAKACDGQLSYLLQDGGAAVENLLLAASILGLGACWLGVHPREDRIAHLRNLLGLPEGVLPMAVIAVGWPAETKPARTRFDAAKVHQGRW
jgi:nitroreductase